MRKHFLFPFLAFLLPLCVVAQEKLPQPDAKADFSKEAFVIRDQKVTVAFEKDGTGTRQYSATVQVLSEAGVQQLGVMRFGYAAANEELEIGYVRVRKPDGTVVQTALEQAQDMPLEITRAAPFYSDLREKHVAVKALAPGDTLEYQVTMRVRTAPVPGQFWFEHSFNKENVVQNEELSISLPAEVNVKVKSPEVKPAIAEQTGRRVYTWKTANLKPGKKDAGDAETAEADEAGLPSVQVSSFQSWEAVGKWYGDLQADRVVPDANLRTKAAELTKGATSDLEKVKAIYNYVAPKFRYVGVAFGVGRYQPHAAAEVFSNQYGDCKDKHTLLAALLKAAGIKAYPALINSGRKLDPDVPGPGQFNHVISVVPLGGNLVWLDTTTELAPFGFLITELRDKEALLIPEQGSPSLVKTPAEAPFKGLDNFDVKGKLDGDGTLHATITRTLRGDIELFLRLAFRRTPEAKWSELVQTLSQLSGFGGTVSRVTISPIEATETPLTIKYEYTRKDYSDWENRRITPPFPPITFRSLEDEKTKRSKPIVLGATGEVTQFAEIELPEHYVASVPESREVKQDFAEYRSEYRFYDGLLTAGRHLAVKAREIPAARIADQSAFGKTVRDDQQRYILLASTREEEGSTIPGAAKKSEADRLFNEAALAFQQGDMGRAMDLTKRTLEVDPNHPKAWTALGFAQMTRGDTEKGIASMRKQIEVSPEEPAAYQALVTVLMGMRRHEEAIKVLRGLLKADPDNEAAAANLGSLLMEKKRYAEAATELESAVRLNPNSSRIHQVLGAALLQSGREEDGLKELQKAIAVEETPQNLNNVAYVLAEANRGLPDALSYADRAVKAEEKETKYMELDDIDSEDLARVWRLATYWDTLGWVYFRMGNVAKAEQYLRAAWTLSQSAVVGAHLGQVYEKQGQRPAAARQYALALAARETMPETRARLERIVGPTQASRAIANARGQLGRLRTTRVKPAKAVKGSAEFFVLIAPDGSVQEAKYVSGIEGLRSAISSLNALHYQQALPEGSGVRLLRRGILMCTVPTAGCDFVLLTPDSVHSVD